MIKFKQSKSSFSDLENKLDEKVVVCGLDFDLFLNF